MNMFDYLTEYYNSYDEDARLRSQHGMVEYLTTMRYIEKYLTPGARILEIGAGTGRYSHALARMGYEVDAVELIEHNIDVFRQNTQPGEKITIRQGSAVDLSKFESETYDITLLLGPMYHLIDSEEQFSAIAEALRVTRMGGTVFVAYCGTDATVVQFCFGKGMILNEPYRSLVNHETFELTSTPQELFVLMRREDIDRLMYRFDVERLHFVGTDMMTMYMRDTVDAMSSELFEEYMRYIYSVCERSELVGISNHFLDILRK